MRKKQFFFSLTLVVVLGGLYGGSYGIIQSSINSQLKNNLESTSPGSNPIILKNVSLIETSPDFLDFNFSFSLNESISTDIPSIQIKLKSFRLYYQEEQLTTLTFPFSPGNVLDLGKSDFSIKVRVGITNQAGINQVINRLVQKENATIQIKGDFKLLGIGVIYPMFSINQNYTLTPQDEGEKLIDFDFTNIEIIEANMKLNIEYTLKIKNPLNSTFSLLGVQGDLYFDDLDGAGLLVPKENIFLMSFQYNWSDEPFILHPNYENSKNLTLNIDIPDIFITTRLIDEILDDNLKFDIEDAVLQMKVYDTIINWEFSIVDIPISTD